MHEIRTTARTRAFRHMLLGATALIGATALPALAQAETAKWSPYFQIEAKPGSERQIGRIELALPLWQDNDSLLFIDARGLADLDDSYEGNLGIAWRSYVDSGTIVGMNFFADYRDTGIEGLAIGQLGMGIELMTEHFDFRANGYLPENDTELLQGDVTVHLPTVSAQFGEARALPGADFEVSYGLPVFDGADNEFRVFAGGYYFDADHFEAVAGPRLRAELRLFDVAGLPTGSRFVVGAEYTYDQQRSHQAFGLAQLRIPLNGIFGGGGGQKLTGLDRRMQDSIRRDPDILIGMGRTDSSALTDLNGNPITDVIFLDEGGKGLADGSSVDNPVDFDTYFAGAPMAGALHVVLGEDGEVQTTGATLLDGQQFIGGGGTIGVSTMMGVDFDFTAPGARPTLHNEGDGTAPIFTLASDNTIAAMDFRLTQADAGDGTHVGILGEAGTLNSDIMLADLFFANDGTQPAMGVFHSSQIGGDAIYIEDGMNVTIDGFTADDMFGEAIDFRGVDTAMLTDITIDGTGRAAILLGANAAMTATTDVTIDGFDISNSGNFGIALFNSNGFTIANGTIDGAGQALAGLGNGIHVANTDDVTVDMVSITDSSNHGVLIGNGIGDSSDNVMLTNLTIDGSGNNGLQIVNSEVTVAGAMITNSDTYGILVNTNDPANQSDVNLSDIVVDTTGDQGVRIQNSLATIDSVDVIDAAFAAFLIETTNTMAVADVTITNSTTDGGLRGLLVLDSLVTADNLQISNVTQRGIWVETTNAMTVADVTVTNSSVDMANLGVYVLNSQFSATDLIMTNIGSTGVLVESIGGINTANADLTDVSVDGADNGISVRNATATIDNATITNSANRALLVVDTDDADGDATSVSISNSTITDMAAISAIRFQGAGELTILGTNNTVTSPVVCSQSLGINILGSVEVNGNPEPATTCP